MYFFADVIDGFDSFYSASFAESLVQFSHLSNSWMLEKQSYVFTHQILCGTVITRSIFPQSVTTDTP